MRFKNAASLPLGVDIGTESAAIVSCAAAGDGFVVRETGSEIVVENARETPDRRITEALRTIVASFTTRERRCVIAAPPGETVTRLFRVPPGMRRGEAERAAGLEADSVVDWPAAERLVALDPIPGRDEEMLLSIARLGTIERLVAIARAAGLRPVAVDLPACAWRRAIPDADAILDLTGDRAVLVIFGEPVGTTIVSPPRLIDDRLASNVRGAFVDARRDGLADVQRLAILGTPFRYESIEELVRGHGYAVAPVALGEFASPPWTLAYGLASWSIAPRGLVRT